MKIVAKFQNVLHDTNIKIFEHKMWKVSKLYFRELVYHQVLEFGSNLSLRKIQR